MIDIFAHIHEKRLRKYLNRVKISVIANILEEECPGIYYAMAERLTDALDNYVRKRGQHAIKEICKYAEMREKPDELSRYNSDVIKYEISVTKLNIKHYMAENVEKFKTKSM